MGGGDGLRYVGIGVNLGGVIEAWRTLRRIFTPILVGHVLPIFKYLAYCVLLLDWKNSNI